ncbi:MAG: ABC transporter substrate-binding protein [Lachnospiraceae bacterium]|nr:ABC transporter substrate-binding protein [Lachnospiraceae bacterium]
MKKRLVAMLMTAAVIASMLTACAGAAGTAAESAGQAAEAVAEAAEEVAEAAGEAVEAAGEWDGDIDEIVVMFADMGGKGENFGPALEAMNAITEKTIGVHADVKLLNMGDFTTQVGLALAGGEQLDIMTPAMGATSFTSLVANGQLYDLTELLENEGSELMALMGEYVEADRVDGKIYGIPPFRNYASSVYMIMRKDILDDLGLTEKAQNLSSWREVEEIFGAVAEGTEISPIGASNKTVLDGGAGHIYAADAFSDAIIFDNIGDSFIVAFPEEDGTVSFLPEKTEYRAELDMIRQWYQDGYVYKDSAITEDHADVLMKTGVIFSSVQTSELGVEVAKGDATGYELVCTEISQNMLTSGTVGKFGLCVPVTSEEPEAAVRWINALYTDPVLENLMIYGVEGTDYVVTDGIASYPEGVDGTTGVYHQVDFMYGNQFNLLPWIGMEADFRESTYDYMRSSEISPFMGFSADMSELANAITALSAVYDQYRGDILCGLYDDAEYDAYIAALKNANVDEYLSALEAQLTAWKAN